ncbi:MAG: hypothetical protein JZD40_03835, partial [Sulfolobus sp.]|nr:hypothetical protein [Sulfolobus sp.]
MEKILWRDSSNNRSWNFYVGLIALFGFILFFVFILDGILIMLIALVVYSSYKIFATRYVVTERRAYISRFNRIIRQVDIKDPNLKIIVSTQKDYVTFVKGEVIIMKFEKLSRTSTEALVDIMKSLGINVA